MSDPIAVWIFKEAPAHLQDISDNGGDEDWLAEVPPAFADFLPLWMESSAFGCCHVLKYPHPDKQGWLVVIGTH